MDGRKDDKGKIRMHLLPFDSLAEIAKVLTVGAEKYAPNNWKKVGDLEERYMDALLRHIGAHQTGGLLDPEDGLSHLAHAGCNLLFLIWFQIQRKPAQQKEG